MSKKMQDDLKDLFLRDGITPFQASKILNISPHTAKHYFEKFADELTKEENHEDWFDREKRVRARALEGISMKLQEVRQRLDKFKKILDDLMESKNLDSIEVERYERIVRQNTILEFEMSQQYDSIEMEPPSEIIFQKELEVRMLAK